MAKHYALKHVRQFVKDHYKSFSFHAICFHMNISSARLRDVYFNLGLSPYDHGLERQHKRMEPKENGRGPYDKNPYNDPTKRGIIRPKAEYANVIARQKSLDDYLGQ